MTEIVPDRDLDVRPLSAAIGAEIVGTDVTEALDDPQLADALRRAFLQYHVLVFRGQDLDREGHKAFGRLFGPLHIHPSQRHQKFGSDREIFVVSADENTRLNNGGLWHADVTCDEVPPLGSVLLLTESPPVGGDTLFANMHLAYETLSAPMRSMLDGLSATHDQRRDLANYGYEPRAGHEYPSHTHPVVVAHPETGRPLLYVNRAFTTGIDGLPRNESDAVLAMLFEHITDPRFHCRVRWEADTLTLWDNRCTQHYAVWDYHPHVRRGERVTIAGAAAPKPSFRTA